MLLGRRLRLRLRLRVRVLVSPSEGAENSNKVEIVNENGKTVLGLACSLQEVKDGVQLSQVHLTLLPDIVEFSYYDTRNHVAGRFPPSDEMLMLGLQCYIRHLNSPDEMCILSQVRNPEGEVVNEGKRYFDRLPKGSSPLNH